MNRTLKTQPQERSYQKSTAKIIVKILLWTLIVISLLMPHAWPLPLKTGKTISQADVDRQRAIALGLAPLYARSFGVPAVMVNHCGPCSAITPPGLIIKLLPSPCRFLYSVDSAI